MRGRPERYTKQACVALLEDVAAEETTIKQYCADNGHTYISVIVALRRHGLSPRACAPKLNTPVHVSVPAYTETEDDLDQAMAEAEGDEAV